MENRINHIISRILTGEVLTDDILSFSEWLNEDEKNRQEFLRLKSYWDAEISYNHSLDKELIGEQLLEKINRLEKKKRSGNRSVTFFPAVAAILLLVVISFSLFKPAVLPVPEQVYTYLTENSMSNLSLPDGSQVSLNRHSRLSYSDMYGKEGRKVRLEGEAFFDVRKDSLQVFEVDLGKATIQVLGTAFSVKCNHTDDKITTTLLKGSIRFQTPNQQLTLQPNQQLIFDAESDQIRIADVDARDEIVWKDGVINYRSISFALLANELSGHYGVPIVLVHNRLRNPALTVSGKFSYDQPLEQVLEIVNRSVPIKWSKKEGVYYIR